MSIKFETCSVAFVNRLASVVVLWEWTLCTWWWLAVVLLELLRYFKSSQTPLGSFPTGQGIQYDCDSSLSENRELHVMSTMDGCLVRNPTISEVELLCGQNWHTKTDHCWSHWRQVSNYLTDWPCISTPKHLHTQIARQPRTTSRWYIATSVNCGYVVLFYTCLNDKLFWKKYTLVSQNRFGITTVLIFKHSFANLTIAPSYSYSLLSADIFQKLSHFQDPLAWKGYNSKQRTLPIKCQN